MPRRGSGADSPAPRDPASRPRRRRPPHAEGIAKAGKKLTGTRNAPTVVNAAYFDVRFWDGRFASLEDQSQHPFVNPVEMGLEDHQRS